MHNSIDGKTYTVYMFVIHNLIMYMSKEMPTHPERKRFSAPNTGIRFRLQYSVFANRDQTFYNIIKLYLVKIALKKSKFLNYYANGVLIILHNIIEIFEFC